MITVSIKRDVVLVLAFTELLLCGSCVAYKSTERKGFISQRRIELSNLPSYKPNVEELLCKFEAIKTFGDWVGTI